MKTATAVDTKNLIGDPAGNHTEAGDAGSAAGGAPEAVSQIINAAGSTPIILICEHAARYMPASFAGLGLDQAQLGSHIAWDIGALDVAAAMSAQLNAPLVASAVSRLLYDCNRPLSAPDAIPEISEVTVIPGNQGLSVAERQQRFDSFYVPFHNDVETMIARHAAAGPTQPVIVTVHSFTPIYKNQPRSVELGILHDTDQRLADALLAVAPRHTKMEVTRNQPYGPQHGVTHSLQRHALADGRLNVMLEIRNDLVITESQQQAMAELLSAMLVDALHSLGMDTENLAMGAAHV